MEGVLCDGEEFYTMAREGPSGRAGSRASVGAAFSFIMAAMVDLVGVIIMDVMLMRFLREWLAKLERF